MSRLAFVDDHKLFSSTLASHISKQLLRCEVDSFDSPKEFLSQHISNPFDIAILDLEMPEMSGVEVVTKLKALNSSQAIVVVSMYYNTQIAYELKRLGVTSFLPKNLEAETLEEVISNIIDNNYKKSQFIDVLPEEQSKVTLLSRRELEIMKWSSSGMSAKEMANKMSIGEATVRTHVRNIMKKTKCANMKELASKFQNEGWGILCS